MPNKKDDRKVVLRVMQDANGFSVISEVDAVTTEQILVGITFHTVRQNQRERTIVELKKKETKILDPNTGQKAVVDA